jgi:hypothetical protein
MRRPIDVSDRREPSSFSSGSRMRSGAFVRRKCSVPTINGLSATFWTLRIAREAMLLGSVAS